LGEIMALLTATLLPRRPRRFVSTPRDKPQRMKRTKTSPHSAESAPASAGSISTKSWHYVTLQFQRRGTVLHGRQVAATGESRWSGECHSRPTHRPKDGEQHEI
jgi:hypothetical protein